jgi:hypothetical protein
MPKRAGHLGNPGLRHETAPFGAGLLDPARVRAVQEVSSSTVHKTHYTSTVLCILYAALVVLLFKFKILKPRPNPMAWVAVAGVLLIGGVVVAWLP